MHLQTPSAVVTRRAASSIQIQIQHKYKSNICNSNAVICQRSALPGVGLQVQIQQKLVIFAISKCRSEAKIAQRAAASKYKCNTNTSHIQGQHLKIQDWLTGRLQVDQMEDCLQIQWKYKDNICKIQAWLSLGGQVGEKEGRWRWEGGLTSGGRPAEVRPPSSCWRPPVLSAKPGGNQFCNYDFKSKFIICEKSKLTN